MPGVESARSTTRHSSRWWCPRCEPASTTRSSEPLPSSWGYHSYVGNTVPDGVPFAGLAKVMERVNDTFTDCALGRDFSVVGGCIVEGVPPGADGWGYEHLADLVEILLVGETVTAFTVMGLRIRYTGDLFPKDGESPRAVELLARLDFRAAYWTAGGGGFSEGLSGWLDATETRVLAEILSKPTGRPPEKADEILYGEAHLQRCRRQFWAVLARTVEEGTGLLWGRDLRLYYDSCGEPYSYVEPYHDRGLPVEIPWTI